MTTLEERRRAAVVAIEKMCGTQAAFAEKSGISQSRLSRALDPVRVTDRRLAPIERAIAELQKGQVRRSTPTNGPAALKEPQASRADAGRELASTVSVYLAGVEIGCYEVYYIPREAPARAIVDLGMEIHPKSKRDERFSDSDQNTN